MRKEYSVALHSYQGVAVGIFKDGPAVVIVFPFFMIEIQKQRPI